MKFHIYTYIHTFIYIEICSSTLYIYIMGGNGMVFDPLLPGVCLHASCHTSFLDPYCSFLLSFIYLFLELLY